MFFLLMIASCFAFAESDLVKIEPHNYDDGPKQARIIFSSVSSKGGDGRLREPVEVTEIPAGAHHYPYLKFYADSERKKIVAETNSRGLFVRGKKICSARLYNGVHYLCPNQILIAVKGDMIGETIRFKFPIVRRISGNIFEIKSKQLGNLVVDISNLQGWNFLGERHPSEDAHPESFSKPFYYVQWSDSYYRKRFLDPEPLFKKHLEKFDKCVLAGKANCLSLFQFDQEELDKFVEYFSQDKPGLKLSPKEKEKDLSLIFHYCLNRGEIVSMQKSVVEKSKELERYELTLETRYGFYDKESKSVIIGQGGGRFTCTFFGIIEKKKGISKLQEPRLILYFVEGAD